MCQGEHERARNHECGGRVGVVRECVRVGALFAFVCMRVRKKDIQTDRPGREQRGGRREREQGLSRVFWLLCGGG